MRHPAGAFIGALSLLLCAGAAALAQETPEPEENASPLAFSGRISGTVYTMDNQPVQGASVVVIDEEGGSVHGSSTNQRGRYALTSLERATYSVLVMDPGGNVLRKDRVRVRPLFRNLVDFVTEPEGSPPAHIHALPPPQGGGELPTLDLKGTLVTTDGEPIPEAWVTISAMNEEEYTLRARTDAEGSFRLLRVPPAQYRISARALGHITWSLGPVLLRSGKDISLRLSLLPFPLGHPENLEDMAIPVDPVPPEEFEKEAAPPGAGGS
jgi:hypothetical protein